MADEVKRGGKETKGARSGNAQGNTNRGSSQPSKPSNKPVKPQSGKKG